MEADAPPLSFVVGHPSRRLSLFQRDQLYREVRFRHRVGLVGDERENPAVPRVREDIRDKKRVGPRTPA